MSGNRKADAPILMGADMILTPPPTIGVASTAVAAAPTCLGVENVTVGANTYPLPPSDIVATPTTPSAIVVVAAAPTPLPPTKATPGATVYPRPEFLNSTPCILSPI